jgi:hypothetical protein
MLTVLDREVVEGEQRVAILDQPLDRLSYLTPLPRRTSKALPRRRCRPAIGASVSSIARSAGSTELNGRKRIDLLQIGAERAGWPKSPRPLTGRLRRAQTLLRTLGIERVFGREGGWECATGKCSVLLAETGSVSKCTCNNKLSFSRLKRDSCDYSVVYFRRPLLGQGGHWS